MEVLTLKSFFGEHLSSVIFTGGTSIFLRCKSENFPFSRRTNDIDVLVKEGSPERKALKRHLRAIPHAEYDRGSETDVAQYITIGRYHIDLLKESLILLPAETIQLDEIEVKVSAKADLAGTKLARFSYNLWANSGSTVIHDLLDTAILHEMALKEPENYSEFLQNACMIFSTRIAPYRLPFEEAISILEQLPNRRTELKEMLVVTDSESPLFGLDEKSFDNILNAFLKFAKQAAKELNSRSADYAEISDILHCSVTPAYLKPVYIERHLIDSGLMADKDSAKEYAQRCGKSPLIANLVGHTPGF